MWIALGRLPAPPATSPFLFFTPSSPLPPVLLFGTATLLALHSCWGPACPAPVPSQLSASWRRGSLPSTLCPHIPHSAPLTCPSFRAFVSLLVVLPCYVQPREYLPLPVFSTLVLHHYFSPCISPLCNFLLGLKSQEAVGSRVAPLQLENSNACPHSALTIPPCPAVYMLTEAHQGPRSLTATKQDVGLPCRPRPRPVQLATHACTLPLGRPESPP